MHRPHSITLVFIFIAMTSYMQFNFNSPAMGDQIPFPEPANENAYAVPIENIRLRVWAQYRVLYNASNIPSGVNSSCIQRLEQRLATLEEEVRKGSRAPASQTPSSP